MKIEEIIKPKVVAEILGISVSVVYSKLKKNNYNKFSEQDIKKLKEAVSALLSVICLYICIV